MYPREILTKRKETVLHNGKKALSELGKYPKLYATKTTASYL
jgi:hypothetical protein